MFKRLIGLLFAVIACTALCSAQTVPQTGAPLNLNLPPYQYPHYDVPVNQNFTTINTWASTITNSLQQLFKGAYSPSTTYSQGQSVTYNGDYYISLINNNAANTPSHTSIQWAWVGSTNANATLPVGIPFTTNVGGTFTTTTMTTANLGSVYGTTPTADLCWLDNQGNCSVPPNGYIAPDKVPYRDPTTHVTSTATAQQLASMFMQTNGTTPCTNGIIMGDGTCRLITALQGVTTDASGNPTSLPETGVSCSGGTCSVAWAEDRNAGYFDPRRPRTFDNGAGTPVTISSDCFNAVKNTINDAVCYQNAHPGMNPIIKFPAGSFSGCGKGTIIPPLMSLIGAAGRGPGDYGGATKLQSGDGTQAMFRAQGSYTATCNGTPVTVSGGFGAAFIEHMSFNGNGTGSSANDTGLILQGGSTYLSDDAFTNFGGPGLQTPDQNSHGDHLFGQGNLGWYMFGGSYNNGAFTDTNWHGSMELNSQDGQWDHIVIYGWLQDGGWYNRFYLTNVLMGGGPGVHLSDSFLQIAPHGVVAPAASSGNYNIHDNRIDDAWFESIYVNPFGNATIHDNVFEGFCTSRLLNPANFATNPVPGQSVIPNGCAAINIHDGGVGGTWVSHNRYNQVPGQWPSWPSFDVYVDPNTLGGGPNLIDEPGAGNLIAGPGVGSSLCCGNAGSDAGRSLWGNTKRVSGTGGNATIHFSNYASLNLSSSAATNWNAVDGLVQDGIYFLYLNPNDTISVPTPWSPEPFGVVGNIDSIMLPSITTASPINSGCGGFPPETACGRSSSYVMAYRHGSSWVCSPPTFAYSDGTNVSGDFAFYLTAGSYLQSNFAVEYRINSSAGSAYNGPVAEGSNLNPVGINAAVLSVINDTTIPALPCGGGVANTSGRGVATNGLSPIKSDMSDVCRKGQMWMPSDAATPGTICTCVIDNPRGTIAGANVCGSLGSGGGSGTVISGTNQFTSGTYTLIFTDGLQHYCTASDNDSVNSVQISPQSGSTITFAGNGSDHFSYICNPHS
jgi:hypothetical protein